MFWGAMMVLLLHILTRVHVQLWKSSLTKSVHCLSLVMWILLLKYFLKIITSVQLHFDPVIEATIFSPSYQTSLAISTPISCQMFFPMQPEWVFHNVHQLKPSIPHAFCNVPNALRGFLCLRALSPAEQKRPCQGQLCLPLLLLHHSSLQCPELEHTGLLNIALHCLAISLCTCRPTAGRFCPIPEPLHVLQISGEPFLNFWLGPGSLCSPSSSSPLLVAYMPHEARANCWFWSPLDLPPGPYRGPTHGTQSILVECINGNEANAGTERQGNWPILGHSRDGFFNTLNQSPIRRGQMEWLTGALQEFILQSHSKREECKFSSSVCHHLVWLPYPT